METQLALVPPGRGIPGWARLQVGRLIAHRGAADAVVDQRTGAVEALVSRQGRAVFDLRGGRASALRGKVLASVASWKDVEAFCPPQGKTLGHGQGTCRRTADERGGVEDKCAPTQKERIAGFLSAVKSRYIQRLFFTSQA